MSCLLNLPNLPIDAASSESSIEDSLAPLWAFIPPSLLPHVPRSAAPRTPTTNPSVVLIADASGFTKLANQLEASEMSYVLNRFFTLMIDELSAHNISVLKFAGDALICHCTTPTCAIDSLRCALSMTKTLNDFAATPDHKLGIHVAILFMLPGELSLWTLGNEGRLEFAAVSERIADAGLVLDNTNAGEVGCNAALIEAIRKEDHVGIEVEHIGSHPTRGDYFRILSPLDPSVFLPPTSAEITPPTFIEDDDSILHPFIPSPVLTYHKIGLGSHLATTRLISVVFISLKSYADFDAANSQFVKALEVLDKHAGLLRQFCPDDKSTVLIAAFGPAPLSHVDDPHRSVRFALETLATIGELNAGVARGTCYCGVLGSQNRCEYVILGSAVNLAARLMGVR